MQTITRNDLNSLPYDVLYRIFLGTHQLRIPLAMAEFMNPKELLAKYAGAGIVKIGNAHLRTEHTFGTAIRTLDDAGYRCLKGKVELKGPFRDFPGDQQDRLGNLDETIQREFTASFLLPENRGFYDPNCDGRSKDLYSRHIRRVLERFETHLKGLEAELGPLSF